MITTFTIMRTLFAVLFLSVLQGCVTAQTGNSAKEGAVINVKDHGARGDGRTNDYAAIQRAIAALHSQRGGTLFFPAGIYEVDEVMRQDEKGKNLNGRTHFYFNDLSNFSIKGETGSVISIKGDFRKRTEWEIKGRNFGYSFDYQISFVFKQCKNITIENLEINGNCDKMTRESIVVENPSFGFLFGENITDKVENVVMRNVYVHHISTDGICWKGSGGGFYAEKLKLTNNGRCALSIVQGKNMRFVDCDFSETGITGKYESHSPNTGVDIENESFNTIENIYFENCRFARNKNTQFVASGFDGVGAGRTTNVHLNNCYFEENREIEPVRDRAVMITTDNSSITNSTIIGTLNFDVNGCSANGQPDKGVLINECVVKSRGNGIRINCDFKVRIENCTIEQLPNLDEASCLLPYPFIGGGQHVYIENNTFIYNSSNWRQGHATILWDLNNFYQGCKSVVNNTLRLKEEPGKPMPKGAVYMIMIDEKFLGKNRITGTDKIVFTKY
jgi:hypothetical protein